MAQLPERGLQGEDYLGLWVLSAAFLVEQVLTYFCRPLTLLPSPATPVPLLQVGSQVCVTATRQAQLCGGHQRWLPLAVSPPCTPQEPEV